MSDAAEILMALGSVLLLGVATDAIGRRTPLPRVTLLLIFGFLVGPSSLNLLPATFVDSFDLTADMALVMVGFLMGGQFTLSVLRERGRQVLWVSILAVAITALIVCAALLPLGVGLSLALLLAGIAPATDPAATLDVIHETKASGPFSQTLLGVVAIDDAWGLILFSICSAGAAAISGLDGVDSALATVAWEIGGAIMLGILIGLPTAYMTGRIQSGEPTLTEALGVVFLCGGLSLWLDVSFLLSSMVVGVVVVNLAQHHSRPFHAIEDIDWPFMVLFFVLSGASLELASLSEVLWIVGVYIVARALGRIVGGWAGGRISEAPKSIRRWIGIAIMPQAGVALGMALVASNHMPQFKEIILPVVISSTVFFELIGPMLTRFALIQVGETQHAGTSSKSESDVGGAGK